MNDAPVSPVAARRRSPSRLAVAAAALAVFLLLLAMLAGLGSRWGLWHFRTGFTMLRWAVYGGMGVAVLALVAAVKTRPGSHRRGFPLAMFALVVALVVVLVPYSWRRTARSVPPIHDITTDTENPPEFVAIAPLRVDAPNEMEYGGPEIASQQRTAYPDVRPLIMDVPPEQAFARALDAANAMGWEIVDADEAAGRIEATDETFWFGFKDDVVIRITPVEGGRSVLDIRSLSRVGGSDVGTNAKRIRAFFEELQD